MKALIVDDEFKAREVLNLMLKHHAPDISMIREAGSASEASQILESFKPDLVFLDIKMPGQDGFSWLRSLESRDFDVIFVTAFDQFAIQAIRYAAFDYLLKPVDIEDLQKAISRFTNKKATGSYENLFYNAQQGSPEEYRLTIPTNGKMHYIDPRKIVRCEADGNYTHFYLLEGRHVISSRPLGHYSGLLPDSMFIRSHKSHLVNMDYIKAIGENILELDGGMRVEVSRRRMSSVKDALSQRFTRPFEQLTERTDR